MIGIVILTVVALVISVILVNLNDIMDNKEEEITKLLPGYNCGACGYKGCSDLARHIIEDPDNYKRCKLLKGENLEHMEEYIKSMKDSN